MPIKKKKSGSAKSTTSTAGADKITEAPADPSTVIEGGPTAPVELKDGKKKKKGKKKKPRLSKAEKLLAKLEKGADVYKQSGENYIYFLDRMNRWIARNTDQAMDLFHKFDSDGDGYLSYDEFKSCMFDLACPCNTAELHLLAKVLDRENSGDIEYDLFPEGLGFARIEALAETDDLYDDEKPRWPKLVRGKSAKEVPHCPCCKLGMYTFGQETNPRFVMLMLKLITFDNRPHHGHFKKLVHSHMSIYNVIEMIKEETGFTTTKIAVFQDRSRDPSAMLSSDSTLEDSGIEGGPYEAPEDALLYYDYTTEFNECPILMCDHYFGQKIGKLATRPPDEVVNVWRETYRKSICQAKFIKLLRAMR